MVISIARLHGEACLICGATSNALLPMGQLKTIGPSGTHRTWLAVACPLHRTTHRATPRVANDTRHNDDDPGRYQVPTPEELLHELDVTLTDQGFTVEVDERLWAVTAQNPKASHLRQVVRLGGRDGEPYWFWEWSDYGRDERPSYEPFCPAQDVGEMANRIVTVLALASTR